MCSSSLAAGGAHKRGRRRRRRRRRRRKRREIGGAMQTDHHHPHHHLPLTYTLPHLTTTVTLTVLVDARLQISVSASWLVQLCISHRWLDGWVESPSHFYSPSFSTGHGLDATTTAPAIPTFNITNAERTTNEAQKQSCALHNLHCLPACLPVRLPACFEDEQHLDVVRPRNDTARFNFQIALAHSKMWMWVRRKEKIRPCVYV